MLRISGILMKSIKRMSMHVNTDNSVMILLLLTKPVGFFELSFCTTYCCSGRGFGIWIIPIEEHDLSIQLEYMSIPCTQQYCHTKRSDSANLGFKTVTPLSTVN
jgi:hypothetical protein